jgi:alpha-tubulin suppressor-like RCC1 family protein
VHRPPRSVKDGQRILHISCGRHHSAAVTEDGYLYLWGLNDHNQLGLGKGQPGDARVLPLLKSPSGTMRPDNGQDATPSGPRIINSTAKCIVSARLATNNSTLSHQLLWKRIHCSLAPPTV